MGTFYFVGGPSPPHIEEFFDRLRRLGGPPPGWRIYPHVADSRALHVITTGDRQDILDHLQHFSDIYEHGEIVEVRSAT